MSEVVSIKRLRYVHDCLCWWRGVALPILIMFLLQALSQATLIAFYPFEGDAVDATGNGFAGTFAGGLVATATVPGFEGLAYDFNNGEHIVLSTLAIHPTNYPQLTAGVWVKADGLPPGGQSGNTRDFVISNSNLGTDDRNIGLGVFPDSVQGWFAQHHPSSLPNGREVIVGQTSFPEAWTFIAAT